MVEYLFENSAKLMFLIGTIKHNKYTFIINKRSLFDGGSYVFYFFKYKMKYADRCLLMFTKDWHGYDWNIPELLTCTQQDLLNKLNVLIGVF